MSLVSEPSSAAYRPMFRPGIVFLSWWALDGAPILGQAATANLLRTVLHEVKAEWPFQMVGYVILPDHIHLLVHPATGVSAARLLHETKRRYQQQYPQLVGSPAAMEVWERRQEIEPVVEVELFARRLDAIHYDAVHHGLVERPEDWWQSSYAAWMERGLYKLGWGWQKPARLREKN